MTLLSNTSIAQISDTVKTPSYYRKNIGVGIVHLGAGAFFKAHQAVYTDTALSHEKGDWGICAVSLYSTQTKDILGPQDGLYTLKILDEPAKFRVIGAVKQVLAGQGDRENVIKRIADPKIHIVTLTITEKGYCLGLDGKLDFTNADIKRDVNNDNTPTTALGILVAGIAMRARDNGANLKVISCDNISGNGTKLGAAVLAFAKRKDAALVEYINSHITFPNTMVDSITPAGDEGLKRSVGAAIGLEDNAPVHREEFTDWVIEDFAGPRPAWQMAGAVFTKDVTPYENAKLRLVNAPHSALTYLGLLSGHKTVAQVMADTDLAKYFTRLTEFELIPSLGTDMPMDLHNYRDRIGARFANTSIAHELFQIATDGSAKLPQRLLPPLSINQKAGCSTVCISLGIAAWMRYVMKSVRANEELNDPLKDTLIKISKESSGEAEDDVARLLSLEEVFPKWILETPNVRNEIINAYELLRRGGVDYALGKMIKMAA